MALPCKLKKCRLGMRDCPGCPYDKQWQVGLELKRRSERGRNSRPDKKVKRKKRN